MQDWWNSAKLDDLLDGISRIEFMLRFTLSHPGLDTTIVGTRSTEHLDDNISAAIKGPLPDDVAAEAKSRLTAAGAIPAWEWAPASDGVTQNQFAPNQDQVYCNVVMR